MKDEDCSCPSFIYEPYYPTARRTHKPPRSGGMCVAGGDTEEIQSDPCPYIAVSGFPQRRLRKHHPHAEQEAEDLHWKLRSVFQTRPEIEENQMKQHKWEQEQISNMKDYIARFGQGSAELARQAQSKEKTLAKMERGGLTEKVVRDRVLVFQLVDVGKLPPPVLQFVEVTFGYSPLWSIRVQYDGPWRGSDIDKVGICSRVLSICMKFKRENNLNQCRTQLNYNVIVFT